MIYKYTQIIYVLDNFTEYIFYSIEAKLFGVYVDTANIFNDGSGKKKKLK